MSYLMRSKFDIIKSLRGLDVLDIGGCGYGETGARAQLLSEAWSGVRRTVLDLTAPADVVCDLNQSPLPAIGRSFDAAVAFDVLEHVKNPGSVLEWIPAPVLWINVPVATSLNCQRIERLCHRQIPGFAHLYSFNMITIRNLVEHCGWKVDEAIYTLDTQSLLGVMFNAVASLAPYWTAMGVAIKCHR
jgi:hypothetical protein